MKESDRSQTTIVVTGLPNPKQDIVVEQVLARNAGSEPADSIIPVVSEKKRSQFARIPLILLVLVLLGVGYYQRELLLKFAHTRFAISPAPTEQSKVGASDKIKVLYWQDPMNPAYKSDKPGKALDGMDLVPVYEDTTKTQESPQNIPPGAFNINAQQQQLIGVQTGKITYQHVTKTLRAVGKFTFDETKISHVHTRTEGWIEKVFADFTGKQIKKGEPLISVYSPDLYQTQQEYLLALKGREQLGQSEFPQASAGAESLYQSTKHRLELWEIGPEQIAEIEKKGTPIKTLTVYAPVDGFVLTRNAYPNQRIMPETELYTIVDLSTIWVIADIYEYEASEVKIGQQATVTLSYLPGRPFKGQVSYIYPQLDSATRTVKVRIEVPNPDYELKADMFANVELKIDYGKQLVIPKDAVLDSGTEQQVFIALGNGYFEPRKINLGAKVDNNFIVQKGLKSGEQIVTSANFLIDSESQLKSATTGMGATHAPQEANQPTTSKPPEDQPKPLPSKPQHKDHAH